MMQLSLTVSCFSKIQTGFTFLVPAHPGSTGQRAVKQVCVCVYVYNRLCLMKRTLFILKNHLLKNQLSRFDINVYRIAQKYKNVTALPCNIQK